VVFARCPAAYQSEVVGVVKVGGDFHTLAAILVAGIGQEARKVSISCMPVPFFAVTSKMTTEVISSALSTGNFWESEAVERDFPSYRSASQSNLIATAPALPTSHPNGNEGTLRSVGWPQAMAGTGASSADRHLPAHRPLLVRERAFFRRRRGV
jgi:hypothetical protein